MEVKSKGDYVMVKLDQDEAFMLHEALEALTVENLGRVIPKFTEEQAEDLNEFTALAASLLRRTLW